MIIAASNILLNSILVPNLALCLTKAKEARAVGSPPTAAKTNAKGSGKTRAPQSRASKAAAEKAAAKSAANKASYNASLAPASIKQQLELAKQNDKELSQQLKAQLSSFDPKTESWGDFECEFNKKRKAIQGTDARWHI